MADPKTPETNPENRPAQAIARNPDGTFPKGVSPNPGGRGKDVMRVTELLREEHLPEKVPQLLKRLWSAAMGADGKKRPGDKLGPVNVPAAKEYLDRVMGKAMQPVEVSGPGGAPISISDRLANMTSEEKRNELAAIFAEAEKAAPAATETTLSGEPNDGSEPPKAE